MSFDPRRLPANVYQVFRQGPMAWPLVMETAIKAGIRDIEKLTDIMFYLHHPERGGRPLGPGETGLINEWKAFRNLIAPRVRVSSTPGEAAHKGTWDFHRNSNFALSDGTK